MIGIERIEEWRGQQVVDRAGEKLGKLDEVYYDSASGQPVLIAVKRGLLGRRSTLVPLEGATAGRDHIQVAHDKATVESAGDAHGDQAPTAEDLTQMGATYGTRFASDAKLQSATEIEARRAEAEAARQRAEDAAAEEQTRLADSDGAADRAQRAAAEADAAEQAARDASQTATDARREAERRRLDG